MKYPRKSSSSNDSRADFRKSRDKSSYAGPAVAGVGDNVKFHQKTKTATQDSRTPQERERG